MKKKNQDFKENRTSWKWFDRQIENSIKAKLNKDFMVDMLLKLEILKELQHLNDSKSSDMLTKILSESESKTTAREVRNLIKKELI